MIHSDWSRVTLIVEVISESYYTLTFYNVIILTIFYALLNLCTATVVYLCCTYEINSSWCVENKNVNIFIDKKILRSVGQ